MKTLTQYVTRFATAALAVAIAIPACGQVAAHQGLTLDGAKTGAVGVSGAMSAQQDDEIATLASTALNAAAGAPVSTAGAMDAVTFIPATKTAAAFAKSQPLIETGAYKVHASRREMPGGAEVHVRDTDVIHVLDGTAVIVTGGTVVEGKTTAMDEIRGARIDGGTPQALAKGDVLIVPNGVPHWFKDVKAPLLYYVVKVTAPATGGTR
jgi:mannose-6-phosphate isomerase-like protein (cupin superfamily)